MNDLEIIFIDDFSDDDTYDKIKFFCNIDARIKLLKNTLPGKVNGLNYGYEYSSGNFIHMIDGDDLINPNIESIYQSLHKHENFVISSIICDYNLNYKVRYWPNIISANSLNSYDYLSKNISFPKWCWILNADIAKKIFPIPSQLPYEDLWISMIVKIHALEVRTNSFPYYYYIQHDKQTYGGILNFDVKKLKFRANRNIIFLNAMFSNNEMINRLGFDNSLSLRKCMQKKYNFYYLLSEFNYKMTDLLMTKLFFTDRVKLFIYKFSSNHSINLLNRFYWAILRARNSYR